MFIEWKELDLNYRKRKNSKESRLSKFINFTDSDPVGIPIVMASVGEGVSLTLGGLSLSCPVGYFSTYSERW